MRRALRAGGRVARSRRPFVRADLRRRRLDRRDVRRARATACGGRPGPRGAPQAELRPARRDARRARPRARRGARDHGRRPPELSGRPAAPRRRGRGRRRRRERHADVAARLVGPDASLSRSSTACCAASRASRSPTSAARSTRTGEARSSRCWARSAGRSSRRRSCSPAVRASSRFPVEHSPRAGRSRYSPLRLTRLALHVLAGFWPQPIQWIGVALGVLCTTRRARAGRLRRRLLDRRARTSPARSSAESA